MEGQRLRPRKRYYGSPVGILLFLLPGVGLYTVLMLYPTVQSLVYSVMQWKGTRATGAFYGFGYYVRLLKDPVVLMALGNNLRALFLRVAIQLPLALLLAFALSRKIRGLSLFRFLYYIPSVTSGASLALLWRLLYTGDFGLNAVLRGLGLGFLIRPWLSTDGIVQWTTNIPETWQWVGFYMVIFLAAVLSIPEEHFEVARLDGASAWEELKYIVLPFIRLVYIAASISVLNDALHAYIYQYILTEGGPLHMSETLMTYTLRQIYTDRNWGYASALAVVHFLLAAVAAGLVWTFSRRSREA